MRGVTADGYQTVNETFYFYSHASCEAWHAFYKWLKKRTRFLLTRLMRGVTSSRRKFPFYCSFLLTRLMRGVTSAICPANWKIIFLLTRLMRGVTLFRKKWSHLWQISTHTPHARRDRAGLQCRFWNSGFLLTRLMRGVTLYAPIHIGKIIRFLLTRLMRGVTQDYRRLFYCWWFLLTRLMRGVTWNARKHYQCHNFYSHASCEAWR